MNSTNNKNIYARKYTEIGHYNEARQDPRHKEAYQKKLKEQEELSR